MRIRQFRAALIVMLLAGCTEVHRFQDATTRDPAGRPSAGPPSAVEPAWPTRAFDGSALPGTYHYVVGNDAVSVVQLAVRGTEVVGTIGDDRIVAELVGDGRASGEIVRPDTRDVVGAIVVVAQNDGLAVGVETIDPRTGARSAPSKFLFARGVPPVAGPRPSPRPASAPAPSGLASSLVGREFGHSSFYSSGSTTTVYGFVQGGVVTCRQMTSTSFGGGMDSTKRGRYQVVGDVVDITVDGEETQAQIVVENGRAAALRIGKTRYE